MKKILEASVCDIMNNGKSKGIVISGFNIHLKSYDGPVIKALSDAMAFGLIMVPRLEWIKFKSGGIKQIQDEYEKLKN